MFKEYSQLYNLFIEIYMVFIHTAKHIHHYAKYSNVYTIIYIYIIMFGCVYGNFKDLLLVHSCVVL